MSDELDDLLDDYAGDKKEKKPDKKEEKQEETKEEESVSNEEDNLGLDDAPKEKEKKNQKEKTPDDIEPDLNVPDELGEEEKKEEGESKSISGGKDKKETEKEISTDDLMDAPEEKKSKVKKLDKGDIEEIEVGEAKASDTETNEKDEAMEERKERRKKAPVKSEDFDYEEDDSPASANILIYGKKNHGKTKLALSIKGTHNAISFDKKTKSIKESLPKERQKDIHVFNGVKYWDRSSGEAMTRSASITWRFVRGLFKYKIKVEDWCVIDGGERFERIAEQVMRYNQGLTAFEGFKNRNLWKERRQVIAHLFDLCGEYSNNGVIWTTYIEKDEIIKDGELVAKKDVPKWIGAVMEETDCVIKVESDMSDETGQVEFYAIVEQSKIPLELCKRIFGGALKTGMKINITNKGIEALVEKPKKKEE